MQEVYEFLKTCGTYYLGTMDGDQPRVRPFGSLDVFEGKLYFQTGKVKMVSSQMMKNPKVEICAVKDNQWVRIEAIAISDERLEAKQHMLDSHPFLKSMYSAEDGNTQVLYLKDATATFYTFKGQPRVVHF